MNDAAPADSVTLVIPGKNASQTLRQCLDSVVPLLKSGELAEIIFVDDGSTDDSADIAATYPVRVINGTGGGPGYARNLGWRETRTPLVWFIDSDCVAEPDALRRLLPHLADAMVAGAGGSYANMRPDSLLACLIHEEIVQRHLRMAAEVDYLASYNVIYRREVLEKVGGFDECRFNGPGSPGAEDIELAFRLHEAGHRLRFERNSRVGHHHPTRLLRYLRSQRHHGYWRVALYLTHRGQAAGDAYSGVVDHAQPALAMLTVATLPLVFWWPLTLVPLTSAALLLAAQLAMTLRLLRRTGSARYALFAPVSFVRAFARGIGMSLAALMYLLQGKRGQPTAPGVGGTRVVIAAHNEARGLGQVPQHGLSAPCGEQPGPGRSAQPGGPMGGTAAERARSLLTPTVSVLMPHPLYFPEAVRSVLNQTFRDFEFVIVEDPSPSSAAALLAPFSDPRVRLIANPERTSLPAQLNQGLAECRGRYLARMDADDICEPTRLEEQLSHLRRHSDLAVLGSQITVINRDGAVIGRRDYPLDHATILRAMEQFNPLAHPTVMFTRDAVLAVGGYHAVGGGVEDYDLWSRLAKRGARFGNYPEALLRYRIHDHSMKSAGLRRMLLHTLKVKRRHWLSEMSFKGRVRLAAEQLLMLVPPGIVLRLFMASNLRPAGPRATAGPTGPHREWQ